MFVETAPLSVAETVSESIIRVVIQTFAVRSNSYNIHLENLKGAKGISLETLRVSNNTIIMQTKKLG